MARTEYVTPRTMAKAEALADIARELGADAFALAQEIESAKREHAPKREARDYGYGQRPEDARRAPMARDDSPAANRMREVANAIPRTADACVTLKGGEITVTRVVTLASSAELEARYATAREREAEAEAALTEALKRARAFAAHSAAKARVSAAATATAKARAALEHARTIMGADAWEACETVETLYRAHWSKARAGYVKREVVPMLHTRRDVMPLGMRDSLRVDPDRTPSDPVADRVVRHCVDHEGLIWLWEAILEAKAIHAAMSEAAEAEAEAEAKRAKRAEAREAREAEAARVAGLDPAMARLGNRRSRRR